MFNVFFLWLLSSKGFLRQAQDERTVITVYTECEERAVEVRQASFDKLRMNGATLGE